MEETGKNPLLMTMYFKPDQKMSIDVDNILQVIWSNAAFYIGTTDS